MKSMIDLKQGCPHRIAGLGKGRGFRARMVSLGIRPGVSITVVGGYGRGPRVLQVGGQRIMIGAEMLDYIFVHEEETA